MAGLGGNINTASVQFYDPYNYPSVTFFESDGCNDESLTYGTRSFSVTGTSADPVLNMFNSTTFDDISYPALHANSALLPLNTKAHLYESGGIVQILENDCIGGTECYTPSWCIPIN